MQKMIAPSILSADFGRLNEEIQAVEKAGADVIHIDVMDGHFVPNLTIGPLVVESVRKITRLPIDVHLMIEEPDHYIEAFAKAGADWISVHVEASRHLNRTLQMIRESGARAGVALNPHTPVFSTGYILDIVDYVLVMTVNPGFGGQKFIESAFKKVEDLVRLREQHDLSFQIEIDGGVTTENIGEIARKGVDVLVTGSAIFGSEDYAKTIAYMKKQIQLNS